MSQWIVAVDLHRSPQPLDRLFIEAKKILGDADKREPIVGRRIMRTEPERLLDVSFGILRAADVHFACADHRVSWGQIPIDRQRPLALCNPLLGAIGDAEDAAQTIVGSCVVWSQREGLHQRGFGRREAFGSVVGKVICRHGEVNRRHLD